MTDMPSTDDHGLWDLWLGSLRLPALLAAEECGVFGALAEAPAGTDALAAKLKLDARALDIVMTLMAAIGMVSKNGGAFALTPQGREYLVQGSKYYWGGILAYERMRSVLPAIIAAKLKGETPPPPPEAAAMGDAPVEAWEKAEIQEMIARGVAAFMESQSVASAAGAARALDLSGARRLLDVGGGSACFAIAFAEANPELSCTVMELEQMCAIAGEYIGRAGVSDRVDALTLDMFRADWPSDYDVIFLSNVFHDWADETNRELAAKAFAALPSGGRIVLHEQLLNDDKTGPEATAAFSILMLMGARGRQYSLPELRDVLESAGFADVQATHSYAYFSAVTARKP